MVAFSSFPMTRRRRSAAQPSYASTMTAVVAAVLVFACVILSSVHEADAQGTTQEYDAMPRHGRSLLQDEPLKDVACDDKCQKWVRFFSRENRRGMSLFPVVVFRCTDTERLVCMCATRCVCVFVCLPGSFSVGVDGECLHDWSNCFRDVLSRWTAHTASI